MILFYYIIWILIEFLLNPYSIFVWILINPHWLFATGESPKHDKSAGTRTLLPEGQMAAGPLMRASLPCLCGKPECRITAALSLGFCAAAQLVWSDCVFVESGCFRLIRWRCFYQADLSLPVGSEPLEVSKWNDSKKTLSSEDCQTDLFFHS